MQEHTHVSDEVRAAVDVHRRAGDIAVAPGRQIGGDGGDLLGQPGAAEIAWLVEVVVDPGHDVARVGGIEAVGGEDVFEFSVKLAVTMVPGHTQLTRMPSLARLFDRFFVTLDSAAFDAV